MHNYIREKEWNDSYVQFGFTCTETTEGLQIPHCMFYNTVFSNANLKPSELQITLRIDMVKQMFQVMMLNRWKEKGAALIHEEHFQN